MNLALKLLIAMALLGSRSAAEEQFGEFAATRPSITSVPTRSPSNTSPPTPNVWPAPQQCSGNNDEWSYAFRRKVYGGWWVQDIGCDDSRVTCEIEGNVGFAREHCCKCKAECIGQCNDLTITTDNHDSNNEGDSESSGVIYYAVLGPVILVLVCCFGFWMKDNANQRDLLATRQTMTQRRQQQRESSDQVRVLYEEESKNARYELFVTKFHFQMVLPDKSNTTADSVRNNAGKQDEECVTMDEEETESELDDDSTTTPTNHGDSECSICLDSYAKGETICAPITINCNHVFHKGCIYEWLKTRDRCPLCRVDLLKG